MEALHHSAAIHIPLALAVLFPGLHLIIGIMITLGKLPKLSWLILLGLSLVQLLTARFSFLTGMRDRALSASSQDLLAQHQHFATQFIWIWVGLTATLFMAYLPSNRHVVRAAHAILIILLALQFFWAIKTGETGGQLVFSP